MDEYVNRLRTAKLPWRVVAVLVASSFQACGQRSVEHSMATTKSDDNLQLSGMIGPPLSPEGKLGAGRYVLKGHVTPGSAWTSGDPVVFVEGQTIEFDPPLCKSDLRPQGPTNGGEKQVPFELEFRVSSSQFFAGERLAAPARVGDGIQQTDTYLAKTAFALRGDRFCIKTASLSGKDAPAVNPVAGASSNQPATTPLTFLLTSRNNLTRESASIKFVPAHGARP